MPSNEATRTLGSALLTFSNTPWYPAYTPNTAAWGLTPLEDQQLAGLLMWVPAGEFQMGTAQDDIDKLQSALPADDRIGRAFVASEGPRHGVRITRLASFLT